MDSLLQDIRYGFRTLLRSPGLTAVAIIALALGIGANTAIFSVVNAVLLRPLAYRDADRLVMVWETNPKFNIRTGVVSYPAFRDWKEQNQVFESMVACGGQSFNLAADDEPERISGMRVSPEVLEFVGSTPTLGRGFLSEEEQPGKNRVVLLSHALWQRRFGSDPDVIGKPVTLNTESYTIIGVLAPDFLAPSGWVLSKADVLVPLVVDNERRSYYLTVMARLKPGVPLGRAQTEMDSVAAGLAEQYPDTNRDRGVHLVPAHEHVVGRSRPALMIFLGVVAFVLLIACVNVANLLLARAAVRQKEIAIRSALGAGRSRLVRQLLTESILLAVAGGVAGLLLTLWGIDLLVAIMPDTIPRVREINIDSRVLGFTLAVSMISGVVFGLVPALQASKPDLNESLKEGGRTASAGMRRNRIRSLLVVSEVALALVLLIGAGLMIKSFIRLLQVDPGFDRRNTLTMLIALPRQRYSKSEQQRAFFEQVIERVGALPGVEAAGVVNSLPLSQSQEGRYFAIEGDTRPVDDVDPASGYRTASPGYFRAMGIPLLSGRFFSERDNQIASGAVIINQEMARRFFSDVDPIGKRIKFSTRSDARWSEVVGVVGDVNHLGLDEERHSELYAAYLQRPAASMYLAVRTATDAGSAARAIRSEVRGIDKDQPVHDVLTMEDRLSESVAARRFPMLLLSIFAVVALVLAAAGIYGVVSYSVTQRTHEIGVRMALGAQTSDVLRVVLRQEMALVLIGIAIGLIGAFLLTRVMTGLLFGVSATDPLSFVLLSVILTGVALGACFVPARRATKVDPMVALRYE
ncbi:MAG: ABC transporter permease [Acidobacteriota bacterium]